jgi:hypothetical protein
MTREEQIEKAAKRYVKDIVTPIPASLTVAFEKGAMWADEHPNDEVLKLRKMFESDQDAYKQGYKDAIEKACEWLEERQAVDLEVPNIEKFISDFRKAMEE